EVAALTLAWFSSVPPSPGATAVIVKGADSPEGRPARVQVIVPPVGEPQAHPPPDPAAPMTPAGSTSVTVIVSAGSGPAFATVTAHVIGDSAPTGSAPSVMLIARSAWGTGSCTSVCSEEALFARFGSAVAAATEAAFTRGTSDAGAVRVSV